MTAHHFFVEPSDITAGVVRIRGDEAHHAYRVLRVQPGEKISAADGTGRIVRAVVSAVGDAVEADVYEESLVELPRPAVTLFQAVGKGDKIDLVVEKATEVGVHSIVPFVADRTIVRWDERKLDRTHQRLRGIAKAAAKQSRAPFVPDVRPVANGPEGATDASLTLVLHEAATTLLRDALPEEAPSTVCLVVGPEGGFTTDEVDALTDAGAVSVSLGSRVLRTETAGHVATAVVGFAYGWFG